MDKGLEHQMDEADCFSPATDRRSRPHEQEAASKQSPEHLPLSGIWEGAQACLDAADGWGNPAILMRITLTQTYTGEAGSLPLSALPVCLPEAGLLAGSLYLSLFSLPLPVPPLPTPFQMRRVLCWIVLYGCGGKHCLPSGLVLGAKGSQGLSCFFHVSAAVGPAHPRMKVHSSAS